MSSFALTMRSSARVFRPSAVRSFQTSRILAASKETAEGNDARKAEIDHHKHEQLKEQKQGKNEWKDALASESESVVKADRGEIKADKSTIKELQEESAKAAKQQK